MKIFDIVGQVVQLNPQSLIIPEFKLIWDRDKTKDKMKATREITYIVFVCDNSNDNPYSNFTETERINILTTDFDIKSDEAIENAILKFKVLNTTKYERVVIAALDSLLHVESYYKKLKDDSDFDILEYLNTTEKLSKAFNSLKDLEKKIVADRMSDDKVRGNNIVGEYEL
jgi:hypothetical protein